MRADVQDWFDRRSSHATDYDPAVLAANERPSIAVVLPALNEERTVGGVVQTLVRDLIDGRLTRGRSLIDELVVVDSGSNDDTVRNARAAGARVVDRTDVLPELAALPGKGEALWRGLAATTSDVVLFIDSDLEDFSSAFATGLIGPFLTDPAIALVKATYDRPLRQGESVLPAGGGRVTELVARPLLNLFWPQLAGFVQPLSGEYAGRRELLESIPFPTGYGVEVAVLIDALNLVGLDGLAQVDLARRKHRNQSDEKLGRMAAEIISVVFDRLLREGRIAMPGGEHHQLTQMVLTQFARDGAGYISTDTDLTPVERPALASLRDHTGHFSGATTNHPGRQP